MCGIVGYISKQDDQYKDEKAHFMRFALALDTLRGTDSTGVMTVRGQFDVNTIKSLMPGDRFVHSDRFIKTWRPGWAQVGHNRAATFGKVNVNNAHPFIDGPIALVHNGTLWAGGTTLPVVNKELEVDSAQIAHNFAEHSPEEAKDILGEIDGAFTLVWFDKRDGSVNMARNSERPMHYCVGKKRDIMWFMSDGAHLSAINKSMSSRETHGLTVFSLDKHIHLKWKKGDLVPEVSKFSPFVPKATVLTPKKDNNKAGADTTKKTTTALERATKQWESNLNERNGATNHHAGFQPPTVKLAGHTRLVPKPMLKALRNEYELSQHDLIQFTPENSLLLTPDKRLVLGQITHPRWGDCVWKAVVINAQQVHTQAYLTDDWLVRPIGITHPWDTGKYQAPAVLCHLVHCDWKNFKKELDKEEAEDEGKVQAAAEEEASSSGFVLGPQQIMLPFARAQALLKSGCISCGFVSTLAELSECQIANEGRDLLCPACVQELRHTTIQ
jgi:hypothetical protein